MYLWRGGLPEPPPSQYATVTSAIRQEIKVRGLDSSRTQDGLEMRTLSLLVWVGGWFGFRKLGWGTGTGCPKMRLYGELRTWKCHLILENMYIRRDLHKNNWGKHPSPWNVQSGPWLGVGIRSVKTAISRRSLPGRRAHSDPRII